MKILYIGQYSYGTTSRMRADVLKAAALQSDQGQFHVIDTHVPFFNCGRLEKSLGFRFKIGPLVAQTQKYILQNIPDREVDICWVDKGILISPKLLLILKKTSNLLVHYTPDTAFFANKSHLFNSSLKHYDYVISTKTFEKQEYLNRVATEKLIFTTQGFDPLVHKPYNTFEEKEYEVIFIGLCEPAREKMLDVLLKANIQVVVGGYGWEKFLRKWSSNSKLIFAGNQITGEEYGKLISKAKIGLGLLSKRFPEKHTTRTFEIPACFTLLATEDNDEIRQFYSDDQVIFYKNESDLVKKLNLLLSEQNILYPLTQAGYEKVTSSGYGYTSILAGLLKEIKAKHE
jgi:spore maturation protein CgeB